MRWQNIHFNSSHHCCQPCFWFCEVSDPRGSRTGIWSAEKWFELASPSHCPQFQLWNFSNWCLLVIYLDALVGKYRYNCLVKLSYPHSFHPKSRYSELEGNKKLYAKGHSIRIYYVVPTTYHTYYYMTYNLERAALNEYDMGKILRGVLRDRHVYVLFEVVFAVILTGPRGRKIHKKSDSAIMDHLRLSRLKCKWMRWLDEI
jgi:hypothetical protein